MDYILAHWGILTTIITGLGGLVVFYWKYRKNKAEAKIAELRLEPLAIERKREDEIYNKLR